MTKARNVTHEDLAKGNVTGRDPPTRNLLMRNFADLVSCAHLRNSVYLSVICLSPEKEDEGTPMDKRGDISKRSKDKRASGLLRGAAVAGVAAGMAAASLGGAPNADATCPGIFGISINHGGGGHCSTSLFGFALGLGPRRLRPPMGFSTRPLPWARANRSSRHWGPLDFLNLAFNSGHATEGATSTVDGRWRCLQPRGKPWRQRQHRWRQWVLEPGRLSADGFGNVALNAIGSNRKHDIMQEMTSSTSR